ncbi:pyruvate:ferredoxin (flavodoxin) oxidoreductase [Photobacterium kishitanii]|uniref:pyruvate:ferredoxin (flavodoxin) oxidoreductase n=1 Tax=Photobacterium kishitanii TaxID=318456 RepID=UPI000D1617CE|nr:pyruvate:ferredoxin (flavodoxin) oxidoreductase [Photobacterium kishitanii]PSU97769.1 pyruvate:ferredoxin (flavodoxin) oxidoreductase [Photobacterium kishitanii]
MKILDGNGAAATIAYKTNEVIGIYPITPSSSMAEACDQWASQDMPNAWGDVPRIMEMQSEGGAIATVHGALMAGSLATSFTSSQGLLLMIPSLYKLAGELTPFVLHVAARTIATHSLSIFGDHSDVMSIRQTGCALFCASSVQQAHDFALISQAATLKSRLPFVHFFDGFRTSHELNKITEISDDVIREMIPMDLMEAHRNRALTPDRPMLRGTTSNPDTFFQAREASNPWYDQAADHVIDTMAQFAELTGRQYKPFEYHGHPDAERVIIAMGSSIGTIKEVVDRECSLGQKVGVLAVHLYRPFSAKHFLEVLPVTAERIAVLDRTKEPGALGEPLFLDIMATLTEAFQLGQRATLPRVIGGRYGLSSKEFAPNSVAAVFEELTQPLLAMRSRFTVGINDDVTHLSLPLLSNYPLLHTLGYNSIMYGLGSDGSVSAAKSTLKLLGDHTDEYVQGYFVYDSKKAGSMTVSHLRSRPYPIDSTYLIAYADFVSCSQWSFLTKQNMLDKLKHDGIFLLNSPYDADHVWDHLPFEVQTEILARNARLYVINATDIAHSTGMGQRINTVMQMAMLWLTEQLPQSGLLALLSDTIAKTYCSKGENIIQANIRALEQTLERLQKVETTQAVANGEMSPPPVSMEAPDFVKAVTGVMLAGKGDELPVSAFPPDGTWPTGTSQWEKRNIANELPEWKADLCTQCNYCVAACPHSAIRVKVVDPVVLEGSELESIPFKGRERKGQSYVLQVSPDDCTGCNLCAVVCPAKSRTEEGVKSLNMVPKVEPVDDKRSLFEEFLGLPEVQRKEMERIDIRNIQYVQPLFEYSGACSGCGETPYIKLLSQLFGDRLLIANATGCSSIYGGNLPTTPYTKDANGRGPAWANSLFEDNAEFGLGYRLSVNHHRERAKRLLSEQGEAILGAEARDALLATPEKSYPEFYHHIDQQRQTIEQLKTQLAGQATAESFLNSVDYLVDKSVWIIGGDGWAYDIGFGGLDQVLSTGENINILVLDTQCYSNTGGQHSKASPTGSTTKFAVNGKSHKRKNLAAQMMMYDHVYVAQVSMGDQMNQTVKAFQEAEAWNGPSLIIAYSPCEEHGYDLANAFDHQKLTTEGGLWPLYRHQPSEDGKGKFNLDSKAPKADALKQILSSERRYKKVMENDGADFLADIEQAVDAEFGYWTTVSEHNKQK